MAQTPNDWSLSSSKYTEPFRAFSYSILGLGKLLYIKVLQRFFEGSLHKPPKWVLHGTLFDKIGSSKKKKKRWHQFKESFPGTFTFKSVQEKMQGFLYGYCA